jgi:hypothetical protein
MRVDVESQKRTVMVTRDCLMISFQSNDMQAPRRMIEWEIANEIFPIKGTSYSGLGRYGATFRNEDAERVLEQIRLMFPEYEIP